VAGKGKRGGEGTGRKAKKSPDSSEDDAREAEDRRGAESEGQELPARGPRRRPQGRLPYLRGISITSPPRLVPVARGTRRLATQILPIRGRRSSPVYHELAAASSGIRIVRRLDCVVFPFFCLPK
jgi:hypothetical protein